MKKTKNGKQLNLQQNNVMNGFEPSFLGIITLVLTINEINSWLQGLLIIATLVYTIIKIVQLLQKQKQKQK